MKRSITIQLDDEMIQKLQKEASLKQISMSSCIRMLLISAMEKRICTDTYTKDNTNYVENFI